MLETLFFDDCQACDDIAVALAQGLQAASHTRLMTLRLVYCEMSDAGMAALASVVHAGCFERLKLMDFSCNNVTDKGMCLLAKAVKENGKRGLPVLSNVEAALLQGLQPWA